MNSVSRPAAQPDLVRVDCCDGKYTVIHSAGTGLRALRYGAEWRDCLGDGLILALASDLEEARAALQEAALQIDYLHKKFQVTGTGEATLARIRAALGAA